MYMYVGLRVPVKGIPNSGLQSGWPICKVIFPRVYISWHILSLRSVKLKLHVGKETHNIHEMTSFSP